MDEDYDLTHNFLADREPRTTSVWFIPPKIDSCFKRMDGSTPYSGATWVNSDSTHGDGQDICALNVFVVRKCMSSECPPSLASGCRDLMPVVAYTLLLVAGWWLQNPCGILVRSGNERRSQCVIWESLRWLPLVRDRARPQPFPWGFMRTSPVPAPVRARGWAARVSRFKDDTIM